MAAPPLLIGQLIIIAVIIIVIIITTVIIIIIIIFIVTVIIIILIIDTLFCNVFSNLVTNEFPQKRFENSIVLSAFNFHKVLLGKCFHKVLYRYVSSRTTLNTVFHLRGFGNDNDDNDDDDKESHKEDNDGGDYQQYHDNGDHRNGRVDDESDDAL